MLWAMLALTDAALAHVVLAASRLPTAGARAALLQRFAAVADPGPTARLLRQRERTRRRRQRRRDKVKSYMLFLSNHAVEGLMNQLIASGHLTERAALDRECFQAALARLLEQQGAKWAP
jgi:hypothetical protein